MGMHGRGLRGVGRRALTTLFLLFCSQQAMAAVWYVNAASTAPTPDGKSWATAFPAIQQAVDAAATGDEVWVAKGIYTGTGTQVVNLKAGVTLYGGFTGTEATQDQRDWNANQTIIDGQQARRCVAATDTTSVVDGCTVRNGSAPYSGARYGGGMSDGSATNCTFTGNTASYGGGMSGGMARNCTFTENSADCYGGGMYLGASTNCTFTANVATLNGGGKYEGTATNCLFAGDSSDVGGGMSGGTAMNCTFAGNSGSYGAAMCGGGATNCIFWANVPKDVDETTVTYSCLTNSMTGAGNMVGTPAFISPWTGDFRLRVGSPGIDAGTATGAPSTDLLGRARPQGGAVDMGAYEHIAADDAEPVHAPRTLRVNAASTAANPDGLTWATAFPTLQQAADRTGYGGNIWVAAGTYTGTGNQVVRLQPGTKLLGGFAGNETYPDLRNVKANRTLIDGQSTRRCVTAGANIVVEAVVIENGSANEGGGMYKGTATICTFLLNSAAKYGGGMYSGAATNCTFTGNSAYGGGGMAGGSATNCTFTGNSAYGGGGMAGGSAKNCTFTGNSAGINGGGMGGGSATNCTFAGNTASYGGGMSGGMVTNCTFTGNSADYCGGGANGSTVLNGMFMGNSAALSGGGMYQGRATNCTFVWNSAIEHGGGMDSGTAVNGIFWANAPEDVNSGMSVTYSCLTNPTVGAGNIARTPQFSSPLAADFRLRSGSPGIDAGTFSGAPSTDLLGRARPQGAAVDMGAYEHIADDDTAPVHTPPILRVNAASVAPNPDGLTWATAFPTLQAAADRAGCGGEIWVTAGTYTGTGKDVVRLRPQTTLVGGFAGNETARDQRNGQANPTVIDGQYARRCVTAGMSVVVDGFVIRNGNAVCGGGMLFGTAVNCAFTGNFAEKNGGGMDGGRATNCTFLGNSAGYDGGGGMHSGTATNCIFWANAQEDVKNTMVTYSCLTNATAGTGNTTGTPVFINPLAGDFRLRAGSPGIDTGTATGAPSIDLLGRARPQGGAVDMGAYEHITADDGEPVYTPPTLRVNAASTAVNPDGLTWETAFPTLQQAADRTGYGGEIWVAAGTYTGTGNEVVRLQPETTLLGGFTGNDIVTAQRNAQSNPTVIDGQSTRRCVTTAGSAVVDGFVLQHGSAEYGGGMHSGTAVDCTFTGNSADFGGGMYAGTARNCTFMENLAVQFGGGKYAGTAVDCTFTGNSARYGGGMHYGSATNCTFTGNSADTDAGGMYDGRVTNCTFTGNSAHYYGGGMRYGSATNCTFMGNTATHYGGGMAYGSATNCTFTSNSVDNTGGGVYYVITTNCNFTGNSAGDGGGMYGGTATNCTVTGNSANIGGGMYDGTVTNCTVTGNSADIGGGMYYGTARNCIIWGNTRQDVAGTTVTYSCLTNATEGTGNMVGTPAFISPWTGDFRLRTGSLGIDAGTATGAPSTDLLGRARPQGGGVDMGAYEHIAADDAEPVYTPPILRVNAASTAGNPDGLTWATAYPTLQQAADRTGYGGTIWVTAGTYTGTGYDVVRLQPGTVLLGAFAGAETDAEQRNVQANPTVIDGQNARRCVTAVDSAVVNGFVIQKGSAKYGGGMHSGTATNCVFTGNSAGYGGGGICYGSVTNCTFTGNSAYYGGGMYYGSATNCTFTGNSAGFKGGGMYSGAMTNCTFTDNSATYGGGTYDGTATNCIIWGNAPEDVNRTTVTYSCLTNATAGTGNTTGTPVFINPWAGDFRLSAGSPGIDTGTATGAPSTDLFGRVRPQGAGVDMGAYEHIAADDAEPVYTPPPLRVNAASTAANPDGLTWETAFPTLQEAADRTRYRGAIWVAAGTYTGTGNEVVRLQLGTALLGGFAGGETVAEQRNVQANPTVIDGQNARRCVTAVDSAVVDGVVIQKGSATSGGGMYYGTAVSCMFTANSANRGGGMYYGSATNCTFTGNSAYGNDSGDALGGYGGAIYAGTATNCVFTGNSAHSFSGDDGQTAGAYGGAMYKGAAWFCTFSGNTASYGGGTAYCTASNCVYLGNRYERYPQSWQYCDDDGCYYYYGPAGSGDNAYGGTATNCTFDDGSTDGTIIGFTWTTVPEVSGLARTAARELLTASLLYGGQETEEYSDSVPVDHVLSQNPAAGTRVWRGSKVDLVVSKGPEPVPVPEVVGLTRTEAADALAAAGLALGQVSGVYSVTVPAGVILSQAVAPGTLLLPGTAVDVTESLGGMAVPDVVGLTRTAATDALVAAGLALGHVSGVYSVTVPAGVILSQAVASGTMVLPGTAVDVTESLGGIAVPDVTGRPQAAAAASLTGAGLVLGSVTEAYSATVAAGSVVSQQPAAGTAVLPGAVVEVVVSRGAAPLYMPDLAGQTRTQAEAAVAAAGLTLGSVTEAHSATVAAGEVISQSPAAGTEVPPGLAVSFVVSLGPAPVETEGEGEPVTADTAKTELAAALDRADGDGDGQLSFTEASAVVPGLTQDVFNAIDSDGDGQLTAAELGVAQDGCRGCAGAAKSRGAAGGDWLAVVMALLGLAAMAGARKA